MKKSNDTQKYIAKYIQYGSHELLLQVGHG